MLALLLAGQLGTAAAETVVIVAADQPLASLSAEQVGELFLGKIGSHNAGTRLTPIDQAENSTVREEFYRKLTGKDAAQLTAYRARMLFTGRGEPPLESGDNDAVKRMVAAHAGLIGYIDRSAMDASVKVLLILR
ncbi:phosphate ABC transporter substrate-binding protein [Pelomonas saccharophila]|nr:phosphate ABC transporter substrate-binding protein [Roseateles saccharophilus]